MASVLGLGDRVATRRNDPDLQVANRQTWTITGIGDDGSLPPARPRTDGTERSRPTTPARFVELAYATTVHGAQGDTVARAHVAIGDTTGAAAAYVAMTRGRETNIAHLVAEDLDEARRQWVETFGRDRADLGPAHARTRAIDDIDRYGPAVPPADPAALPRRPGRGLPEVPPTPTRGRKPRNRPLTTPVENTNGGTLLTCANPTFPTTFPRHVPRPGGTRSVTLSIHADRHEQTHPRPADDHPSRGQPKPGFGKPSSKTS